MSDKLLLERNGSLNKEDFIRNVVYCNE